MGGIEGGGCIKKGKKRLLSQKNTKGKEDKEEREERREEMQHTRVMCEWGREGEMEDHKKIRKERDGKKQKKAVMVMKM